MKTPQISFIMVKPDAINNMEIQSKIFHGIRDYNLLDNFRTILTEDQLYGIWPKVQPRQCPFTAGLLKRYLLASSVQIIVIEGRNIFEKCRALKREIRRQHAQGAFANCLHCPSDSKEAVYQLSLLWKRSDTYLPSVPLPHKIIPLNGIWGRLAALTETSIQVIVGQIWDRARKFGWDDLDNGDHQHGEASVVVMDDCKNSVDYAGSCIYEVLGHLTPRQAIEAVIEIDFRGRLALISGEQKKMEKITADLSDLGLKVSCDNTVSGENKDRSLKCNVL